LLYVFGVDKINWNASQLNTKFSDDFFGSDGFMQK